MRWVAITSVLVGLVGCRQILGLEGGVVATVGHDEDLDGVDDGLDNCPADPNPAQTTTEPGIGSVCDPHPEIDGDQVALFLSFFPDGQPDEVEDANIAYANDVATITNADIRTADSFSATAVTAQLLFGSFVGAEAAAEIAVGNRVCRIASCGSRICVYADDGMATGSMMFTPSSIEISLALVQTDTMLACVLAPSVVVTLPETDIASGRVRVGATAATMAVKNIAIYDAP